MTASELAWETFKGLGSLAGFWSTGYVLWDRYWKHVPQAVVVARPVMEGSVNIVARLAITNLAPRPILIGWENKPGEMRVALDDTLRGVIGSQFPKRTVHALAAVTDNVRCLAVISRTCPGWDMPTLWEVSFAFRSGDA